MPGSDKHCFSSSPAAESDTAYIQVQDVSRMFGTIRALDHVSFCLEKGCIAGFLGSDGAGKTTLLRIIATMIPPSSGKVLVHQMNAVHQKDQVKSLIGYMPQRFGLYQDLTVEENFDFFMDIYGIQGRERRRRKERYLGFSNLLPFLKREAGHLSGGMKQKLGLACVLVHEPDLLILDEPTNGVDPVSRQEFWHILSGMKAGGMTILVSTAYMDEGEKCDHLILMHDARVLDMMSPEQLQAGFSDLEEAVIHRILETDKTLSEDQFGG